VSFIRVSREGRGHWLSLSAEQGRWKLLLRSPLTEDQLSVV